MEEYDPPKDPNSRESTEYYEEIVEKSINLFDVVLQFMHEAEVITGITGDEKRNYVISAVKLFLINKYGLAFYRKYRTFIPYIIEFLISVSRNGLYLLINNI